MYTDSIIAILNAIRFGPEVNLIHRLQLSNFDCQVNEYSRFEPLNSSWWSAI
jgi:hypothetical protein